uniref:FTH domain-containing protein n=1 Tax=Rhabditophanes sp. KR3021 TaxID=114890 RepID=A0AC35TL22_9BILA
MTLSNQDAMKLALKQPHILQDCLRFMSNIRAFSQTSSSNYGMVNAFRLHQADPVCVKHTIHFYNSPHFNGKEFDSVDEFKVLLKGVQLNHWEYVERLDILTGGVLFNNTDIVFATEIVQEYSRKANLIRHISIKIDMFHTTADNYKSFFVNLLSNVHRCETQKISLVTNYEPLYSIVREEAAYFKSVVKGADFKVSEFEIELTCDTTDSIVAFIAFLNEDSTDDYSLFKLNVKVRTTADLVRFTTLKSNHRMPDQIIIHNRIELGGNFMQLDVFGFNEGHTVNLLHFGYREFLQYMLIITAERIFRNVNEISLDLHDINLNEENTLQRVVPKLRLIQSLRKWKLKFPSNTMTNEKVVVMKKFICGMPRDLKILEIENLTFDIKELGPELSTAYPGLKHFKLQTDRIMDVNFDAKFFSGFNELEIIESSCLKKDTLELPDCVRILTFYCYYDRDDNTPMTLNININYNDVGEDFCKAFVMKTKLRQLIVDSSQHSMNTCVYFKSMNDWELYMNYVNKLQPFF